MLYWWHWAAFGFGLVLSELVLPTFVLIWFGLGGLIVAALLALLPDMPLAAQLFVWTAGSLLMTGLWFKVFRKDRHVTLIGQASAHIEGEVGLIVEEVAPYQTGKIRFQKPVLGSDLWVCRSEEALKVGERAKVVKIEGNSVFVKPAHASTSQQEG